MEIKKSTRAVWEAILVIGILAVSTGLSLLLDRAGIGKENTLMVYMVGILLITAFTRGYYYGIIGSIVSVMIFNYFFAVPLHTFAITNTNDILLVVFFLLGSFISSSLTVRFQKQMLITKKKEETATLLFEMSEKFINITGKENIIKLGIAYILEHTKYQSAVEIMGEEVTYGYGRTYQPQEAMLFPIYSVSRKIGMFRVYSETKELTKEQELLIKAAANQIGIALDRELIYAEQEKTKIQVEKEHMKSSMLRSISHDFRTPLTGIIGDCGYLLETEGLAEETMKQFANDISEQAAWLMRMMENILSMTRIESGQLHIQKQWEVVDDIVNESILHVIGLRETRNLRVFLPDDVIVSKMDGKMMVQVLINLLDNAVKHTKEDGNIALRVSFKTDRVYFAVDDDGEGIEPGMEEQIFNEFISLSEGNADKKRGIGLGLTICSEVVHAHHGKIWAENKEEGGAKFTFWLHAKQGGIDGE